MGAETQGQETAGLRAARPGPVLWLFRDAVWVPVEGRLYGEEMEAGYLEEEELKAHSVLAVISKQKQDALESHVAVCSQKRPPSRWCTHKI